MSGYGAVKDRMSAEDVLRRRSSPGASTIRRCRCSCGSASSRARCSPNYLNDPVCDNYSVLIVLDAAKDVAGARPRPAERRSHYIRHCKRRAQVARFDCTDVPGPQRGDAGAARGGRAVGPRQRHRRRRRARRGRAGLRRRRQHAASTSPAASACSPSATVRRRGRARCTAQAQKFIHVCALVATYEPYVRLCELLNEITPGDVPEEDDPRQQRRRERRERRQAGARRTPAARRHLLRGRLPRPHAADAQPDEQVRPVQEAASARSRRRSSGCRCPNLYRAPAGMTRRAVRRLGHPPARARVHRADRSVGGRRDHHRAGAGRGRLRPVPPRFLRRIRELCTEHGIVMIADEVQCGFGRTGRLFAVEHYGIVRRPRRDRQVARRRHADQRGHRARRDHGRGARRRRRRHLRRQPGRLRRGDRGDRDHPAAGVPRARRRIGDVMREVMNGWQGAHPLVGDVRGLGR